MQKLRPIILLLMLFSTGAFSQNYMIEESIPLREEPVEGWLKLLQLANGNTAILHITEKEGMEAWVYDTSRKLKINKKVYPQFITKGKINLKTSSIEGFFSAGSDLVLFISILHKRTPVLFRVIIDTETGRLKKEEEIARLNKYSAFAGYAMAYGNVPPAKFYIRKDDNSDNYAVALFNSFESDRNKRIKLIHYGTDHETISDAYYISPNDEYKYLELIDLIVMGDKKIIACANGFNTNKTGEGSVLFASLEKDKSQIDVQKLQFTDKQYFPYGMFRYNKKENLLVMLALKQSGSSNKSQFYAPKLIFFDPDTYSTVFYKDINAPNVNSEYQRIFGEKKSFSGLPQIFYINADGTYTVVYEEITTITSSKGSVSTVLGSMAVSVLNNKAQEQYSHFIAKRHLLGGYYPPLYLASRHATAQRLLGSNQYKAFDYANGSNGKYLFFNDVIENVENVKKGKLTSIVGISACDAFICEINNKSKTFNQSLLYGEPEKKAHNFALFTVSDYNQQTGYYATLKLENNRGKKLKVTWIKLD